MADEDGEDVRRAADQAHFLLALAAESALGRLPADQVFVGKTWQYALEALLEVFQQSRVRYGPLRPRPQLRGAHAGNPKLDLRLRAIGAKELQAEFGDWLVTTLLQNTLLHVGRQQGERDRHALRLSITSTRKRKRTTRRRRSSSGSGSGRLTRADVQAMGYLDQLLAEERRLEQTYSLPFRAPPRVATTVQACARCGQDLLLLIFGDQAHDAEGLLAYGRLMREAIVARGLPAYVLGAPEGDGARDDTPSLLLQVWPEPDEPRRVTPGAWDSLVEQRSQAHCPR